MKHFTVKTYFFTETYPMGCPDKQISTFRDLKYDNDVEWNSRNEVSYACT